MNPENVHVSILIRTKNEEESIGKTLDVLFSQTYKNFEVLIVDSGSEDGTLEVARKYPVKVFEIRPEDFTWGYALNYGFQKTKGRYVFCLSAHALPLSNDWIEIMVSNFSDDEVAAVMSNTIPWPDCNPFDRRGLMKKFNIEKQELKEGPPFVFGNTSSAIRKSTWETIKFDESLSYCEDHDWLGKVRKAGFKAVYEPEAKVYHSHNETLKQIYRRSYQQSYALSALKLQEFSLPGILFDFIAGSAYDMAYVLLKQDNVKWFFYAPLRRFAMNLPKYKALRTLRIKRSRNA